jgi:hypothetical protein
MSGLFEDLAQFDDGKRVAGRQAAAVAQKRVADRFGSYLKIAKNADEYAARLSFVEDDVRQIVADVAEEYNADLENLQETIDDHLKGDGVTDLDGDLEEAPSAVGHKAAGGHASDCTCGFCKNKGNLPGSKKDDDSDSDSDTSDSDSKDDSSDDDGDDKPDFLDKDSSARTADVEDPSYYSDNPDPQSAAGVGINEMHCPDCGGMGCEGCNFTGVVPINTDEFAEGLADTLGISPLGQQPPQQMAGRPIAKTADADRDGGGAVTREKLPTGDGKSVGTEPSPKIDKKEWKPNALNDSGNLKPIDSEQSGSPVPTEKQDITDGAEYESQGEEGDGFLDQTDSVVDQQTLPTADDSGQSTERNVSGQDSQSDTWHTNDGQTDPVGSEVLSKEANGFVPEPAEPTNTFPCANCGTGLERYRGEGDISCPSCGAEHNSFGQRLAPRSQWGEETGESLSDINNPRDPEGYGYPYEASTDPDVNPL